MLSICDGIKGGTKYRQNSSTFVAKTSLVRHKSSFHNIAGMSHKERLRRRLVSVRMVVSIIKNGCYRQIPYANRSSLT
ncbi:hypothetical protein HanIR_Chr07g0341191 [Helianthus annuus]|nr:hypothetical protein HanIR_Chr07g0341191 [Helianthus annuus]